MSPHSLAWRHLARRAERSPPNAAQRLRRRRKGLTANGASRATMLLAMMDFEFRRSDRRIGPSECRFVDPHPVQDHGKLTCHGDFCAFQSAALCNVQSPFFEDREAG